MAVDICASTLTLSMSKPADTRKILEGIATVLAGIIAACILPADLASARFLTPEERDFAGALAIFTLRQYLQVHEHDAIIVRRFEGDGKMAEVVLRHENGLASEKAEEGSHSHTESVQSAILLETQQADEKFEWREVMRGSSQLLLFLILER